MYDWTPDLTPFVPPLEHEPGRIVVGRADPGDLHPEAYAEYEMIPTANQPADPVRPSHFDDYTTSTGVYGAGIDGARTSIVSWINPFAKHGQRDFFNENTELPGGKPTVIIDNRGRVLDARMQAPGQLRFRYDVNIPRPAYMSFSDLLDQEGVQQ